MVKMNQFSSERKMMSVVVRNQRTGLEVNYSKGADAIIKAKLEEIGATELQIFNQVEHLAAE